MKFTNGYWMLRDEMRAAYACLLYTSESFPQKKHSFREQLQTLPTKPYLEKQPTVM